jgi:hypothetical protein
MLGRKSALVLITTCAAMAACSPPQNKGDMLANAGFNVVPANTPQRQASLAKLPPHKFVHRTHNNVPVIVYADPTICDCLYVGNQAAYDRYRQQVFAQNMANEQERTAQISEAGWGEGDYSVWGAQ